MSDQEKLYRCMGGSHCDHIPGSCTATNTAYQGRISPGVVSHPATTNPVDGQKAANVSDKLRDAYSVWTEAFRAWNNNPETVGSSEDAAAVIEADRQATRAALVAEIVAWLRSSEERKWDFAFQAANDIEAKWGKQ